MGIMGFAKFGGFVMLNDIEGTGFSAPTGRALGQENRAAALASLIASAGLALAIIIAVTVVSAGIAHASVASNVIDDEGSLFAVALLLGVLFIGMGGLTILTMPGDRPKIQKHVDRSHPTVA